MASTTPAARRDGTRRLLNLIAGLATKIKAKAKAKTQAKAQSTAAAFENRQQHRPSAQVAVCCRLLPSLLAVCVLACGALATNCCTPHVRSLACC